MRSGFSNESMITVGALFLVIGAVEKSHIVDYFARKAFGLTGSNTLAKLRMFVSCFCLDIDPSGERLGNSSKHTCLSIAHPTLVHRTGWIINL